jgi:exopolysaccharide biosynthesis WecB/TagA/CpsF family protein
MIAPLPLADKLSWPQKRDVFGVGVSVCDIESASGAVIEAAKGRQSAVVSCFSVHALVSASNDAALNSKTNQFEMITPDGQPVRWALNLLHRASLHVPVTGRALTEAVCARAAAEGVGIYIYGSSPATLERFHAGLLRNFPSLRIVGEESPPFRALTPEEDAAVIDRINSSGAGIVLHGLGCPKQDEFAFAHRGQIHAVQMCVGAVFDFIAGTKPVAPRWMQRYGLEWLHRLSSEPRRLFVRYATTNTQYGWKLFRSLMAARVRSASMTSPILPEPARAGDSLIEAHS